MFKNHVLFSVLLLIATKGSLDLAFQFEDLHTMHFPHISLIIFLKIEQWVVVSQYRNMGWK